MSSSLWAPNRSPWSLKTNSRITDSACLLFVLRTPADGPIIRTRRAEAETHVKVAVNKPLRAGVWDLGLWELQADINWLITEATCLPVAGCNNKCAVWRSPAVVLKCLYRKKRSWEINFTCRVMTSCRNIFKCQTLSFLSFLDPSVFTPFCPIAPFSLFPSFLIQMTGSWLLDPVGWGPFCLEQAM